MEKRGVYNESYDKTETEAIIYLKSLISFEEKHGNDTTISVIADHLRRHMNDSVMSWFVKQYPNQYDYFRFFRKHKHIFEYDSNTGIVTLKAHVTQHNETFTKPLFLVQLESDASELLMIPYDASKTRDDLNKASQLMLQFEVFYMIFNIIKYRYENFQQNALLTTEVKKMMGENAMENRRINEFVKMMPYGITFTKNLVKFLTEKIPQIFVYDESDEIIQFRHSLLIPIQEIYYVINDTAIKLLKTLTIKLLRFKCESMGCLQIETNTIIGIILKKHPHVFGNLFPKYSADSFLNDFLMKFPDTFVLLSINGRQFMALKIS